MSDSKTSSSQSIQFEIQKLEAQMYEGFQKLEKLRKEIPPVEVKNYKFQTSHGAVSLLDLFEGKNKLVVIHNMGQGCRYCTLWADGLNAFLPHLESAVAVVLVSKDSVEVQRNFANARGWRFKMASHGGGDYIKEQSVTAGQENMPGLVTYEREGERILKKNSTGFGPGDMFCSIWSVLSMAGLGESNWTPQYTYWSRPSVLEDGGKNVQS